MEDRKESGYPVYAEDVLGGLANVASASDCTGLEPTPPQSANEVEAYATLSDIPTKAKNPKKSTEQKQTNK